MTAGVDEGTSRPKVQQRSGSHDVAGDDGIAALEPRAGEVNDAVTLAQIAVQRRDPVQLGRRIDAAFDFRGRSRLGDDLISAGQQLADDKTAARSGRARNEDAAYESFTAGPRLTLPEKLRAAPLTAAAPMLPMGTPVCTGGESNS